MEMIIGGTNILRLTDNSRMAECDEETSIEYGFQIGEHEGY